MLRAATIILGVLWFSAGHTAQTALPAKVLTLRIGNEPVTLDWNLAHSTSETYLLNNLMEGLVSMDSKLRIQPALAQSWKVSPDGKVYTFFLRKDVKWSDAVLMTANDFVYGWKRLLSPLTASTFAYLLFDVEGAEEFHAGSIKDFDQVGVKALDPWTLQVTLRKPVANWIYIPTMWSSFPMREDVVKKYGVSWAEPGKMVTLGPFQYTSYQPHEQVVLNPNGFYYGRKPELTQVVVRIVQSQDEAIQDFITGKLDVVTGIDSEKSVPKSAKSDLRLFTYLKVQFLGFAISKYPMSNIKFRRAIAMALDRKKLDRYFGRGATGTTKWIPTAFGISGGTEAPGFSPKDGRRLLRAEGFVSAGARAIDLLILDTPKNLATAQWIQSELKENLGLQIRIQPYESKEYFRLGNEKAFPIYIGTWGADFPDADNFMSVFLSDSGANRTGWSNTTYDALVLKARGSLDKKIRDQLYSDAQTTLLNSDMVIVPLFEEPNQALIKKWIQGFELTPLNYLYLKNVTVGK